MWGCNVRGPHHAAVGQSGEMVLMVASRSSMHAATSSAAPMLPTAAKTLAAALLAWQETCE